MIQPTVFTSCKKVWPCMAAVPQVRLLVSARRRPLSAVPPKCSLPGDSTSLLSCAGCSFSRVSVLVACWSRGAGGGGVPPPCPACPCFPWVPRERGAPAVSGLPVLEGIRWALWGSAAATLRSAAVASLYSSVAQENGRVPVGRASPAGSGNRRGCTGGIPGLLVPGL